MSPPSIYSRKAFSAERMNVVAPAGTLAEAGSGQDRLPALSAGAVALGLRLALAAVALGGLYGGSWISVAPNRLLPGEAISAAASVGGWVHAAALALFLFFGLTARDRSTDGLVSARFALPLGLLIGMVILTGLSGASLLQGRPASARCMVGAGFWAFVGSVVLLLLDEARELRPARVAAIALGGVLALALARRAGFFDALSIFVEYRARADLFHAALARHLGLSFTALGLALAVSIPLGWAAFRHPRFRAAIDAGLSGIQVIPAVALFGLLVSLLSLALAAWPALRGLGLAAIGPTPALIGVAAYLALPLTRGVASGLGAADPALIETAQGMGMPEARIAWEVRLPLGLPVFIAGLRVAAVQSIGLVTLGGLIGAGGLGALVFEGMAQFASDLIILGSAPIVAIAILADLGLRALELRLARPLS
jgi:osmoprotectant transport system permease protein